MTRQSLDSRAPHLECCLSCIRRIQDRHEGTTHRHHIPHQGHDGRGRGAGHGRRAAQAPTVDAIKKRGELVCGVSQGSPRLHRRRARPLDRPGRRPAARAGAAVLGATRPRPASCAQFAATLSRAAKRRDRRAEPQHHHHLGRDAGLGIVSGHRSSTTARASWCRRSWASRAPPNWTARRSACSRAPSTNRTWSITSKKRKLSYRPVVIENLVELEQAFYAAAATFYLSDASTLAASRAARAANPDDFVIRPNASKVAARPSCARTIRTGAPSCAGPSTRWWPPRNWASPPPTPTARRRGADAQVRRLLGAEPGIGKSFGLDEQWARNAIKAVGNYGEVWNRNLARPRR